MSAPDPKPEPRIRNPRLLRRLHWQWRECALCGSTESRSLHHILKHPRDDVRANLVMLCGSGTTGCHGRVEAHDADTLAALYHHIVTERSDVYEHLALRLGDPRRAQAWLDWNLVRPSLRA